MLHKIAFITLAPLALLAQTGVTFTYQVSGASGIGSLASGGTVVYPAVAVGSASLATIYCSNQSQSTYTLTASAGSALFVVSPSQVQLAPGASAAIGIRFTPNAAGLASATASFILTDSDGNSQVVRFALSAQALDGVLASAVLTPNGNQTPLADGATFAFPPTPPGSASPAIFTISNHTASPVSIDSVLLSGTSFSLSGLPLMPFKLAGGAQMSVGLAFAPNGAASFSGTLSYSISGVLHSISLTGTGAAASLEYAIGGQAIQPGATISFPAVAVGSPAVLTIQVGNTGTAGAQISTLAASPSEFQLQNPPTLPISLAIGQSASFTVAFVPAAPGAANGLVKVGNMSFVLAGVGLGAQFGCTITAGGQTVSNCGGSTITLPSTSLGSQLPFTVQIANSGNQSGVLQNLAIGGTGFSITAQPTLPVTLAAGDSIQVGASFAPTVLGLTGGYLQINGQTFNITVAATAPPALPAVSFTNATAQMLPLQQPSIGIHLAAAYPYDLAGTLSLSFKSDLLVDDPSIQFLNGQRNIGFEIPAGSVDAVFGVSSSGVVMQTGSTAGVITLSAALTLGQYVVTGSSPVTQDISIPAAAPQILSFQIGSMDTAGFNLLLTGLSDTRSLNQLAFTFTPTQGSSLATTTLTADVSAAFNSWYQSAASDSFGGQFTVSVRFNVTGAVSSLQSVTATATNGNGTSAPQSVALQSSGTQ